ncbi:MAG: zinc ribbon domain-containing protein [Candidatus Hermodarchaeota archaeon]
MTDYCISCGMDMTKPEEYGGGKEGNESCVYCSDSEGNLKPRNEVREGMIKFWMQRENIDRDAAEKNVDEYMAKMPAWKK